MESKIAQPVKNQNIEQLQAALAAAYPDASVYFRYTLNLERGDQHLFELAFDQQPRGRQMISSPVIGELHCVYLGWDGRSFVEVLIPDDATAINVRYYTSKAEKHNK